MISSARSSLGRLPSERMVAQATSGGGGSHRRRSARRGEERRARLYGGRQLEDSLRRSARRGEERRARLYGGRQLEDSLPQSRSSILAALRTACGYAVWTAASLSSCLGVSRSTFMIWSLPSRGLDSSARRTSGTWSQALLARMGSRSTRGSEP